MRIGWFLAVLMVSGCVLGGAKGTKPTAPAANPITGAAISTTALAPVSAAPAAATAAGAKPAQPADAAASPPQPAADAPTAAKAEIAPPEPQTPAEVKCLKSGGIWASAGKSGAQSCVQRTRDGGKFCTKQTQCQGTCLARSNTCAPITPMFGCNDILQADGREVTLCLD